jgi:two-component system CheB/CheR fusion protein
LEASKEELQSVNEELQTVNAELSNKVDALDRANTDLQNPFESTEVGTVFLDRSLAILPQRLHACAIPTK